MNRPRGFLHTYYWQVPWQWFITVTDGEYLFGAHAGEIV